jgi:hypothetical protein
VDFGGSNGARSRRTYEIYSIGLGVMRTDWIGEMFIVHCSIVICHFRMRLRRDINKKKLREAPPPMTNDN